MTARTLAEDFHWLTDGCGRVWILERDDVAINQGRPPQGWPEAEAPDFCFEPEPEAEQEFQVGQWVKVDPPFFLESTCAGIGTIGEVRYAPEPPKNAHWRYIIRKVDGGLVGNDRPIWIREEYITPHAPVLTDDQRRIQPGDTVRVIDVPVGRDGIPFRPCHCNVSGREFVVQSMKMGELISGGRRWCSVEGNNCERFELHNLELVEKGGQP